MSGSGGGGGDWRPVQKAPVQEPVKKGAGDGGGAGVPVDPCAISERTTLNSVNRAILTAVRGGDLLDVVYEAGPPQRLVAQANGSIVGSITGPSMLQFIQCMLNGRQYVAEVIGIQGGTCQVLVRPK